jgi:hypothetical protein
MPDDAVTTARKQAAVGALVVVIGIAVVALLAGIHGSIPAVLGVGFVVRRNIHVVERHVPVVRDPRVYWIGVRKGLADIGIPWRIEHVWNVWSVQCVCYFGIVKVRKANVIKFLNEIDEVRMCFVSARISCQPGSMAARATCQLKCKQQRQESPHVLLLLSKFLVEGNLETFPS